MSKVADGLLTEFVMTLLEGDTIRTATVGYMHRLAKARNDLRTAIDAAVRAARAEERESIISAMRKEAETTYELNPNCRAFAEVFTNIIRARANDTPGDG